MRERRSEGRAGVQSMRDNAGRDRRRKSKVETNIQTDRLTVTRRDRDRDRQSERPTDREKRKEINRQTDREKAAESRIQILFQLVFLLSWCD